ncbi:MAG: hypothetical protein Cons2KO_18690 [Congregibacter sp.]
MLPFTNLSDDNEQASLADGMTEDIITGLAAVPNLSVTARNSTFAFKGKSPDVRDVGQHLKVRYVLEGSIRRIGEKIRVTAQLIESMNGNHLWAKRYDRPYNDIFAVQDEVVGDIAGALSLQITEAEIARSRTVPPTKLEAWELVTHAMHLYFRSSTNRENLQPVLEALKRAVELDSSYGYARAAYAWILMSSAINGLTTDVVSTINESGKQLDAALELDTGDPLSRYYIGAAYCYRGRPDKAVKLLELSLTQAPHQPDAMAHLGLAMGYLGQFTEAYDCFDKVARMGENEGQAGFYAWYRGLVLCLEDRYAEAVPIFEKVVSNYATYQTPKLALGIAYEITGDSERAKAVIERAVQGDPALNKDGLVLNFAFHMDREKGKERAAILEKYWPTVDSAAASNAN